MSLVTAILIGLLMGAVFGFALEKSRVFEPGVIVGQMQLRNFIMLKVFLTAVATGGLRVLEVRIEPGLLESGDRDMIQDLVAAAVNAALANAQQMIQEEMQRASSGLAIPMPGVEPAYDGMVIEV